MRQGGREAVVANRACESCHEAQAAEWGESLHHRANVEPTYVRSFAVEPLAFCTGCHAPEAPGATDLSAGVSVLGVGCVTCHGTGDRVLGAPSAAPKAAPHGVVRDARFTTDAACGGCHQFAFPDAMFRKSAELMQSTVRERGASTAADIACASCHMPANGQRRDHRFRASRDPESVRSAVHVTARRLDERRVEIVLAPRALGHAFPTGDMFRRLEISAEAVGEDNMVLAEATRYLARHFENRTHGAHALRTLVADDRVGLAGAQSTSVVLDVGAPARGRPIAYRVAYQRVETPRSVDDRDATIDGDIALAEGVLPP
jgi:hypothetical protein